MRILAAISSDKLTNDCLSCPSSLPKSLINLSELAEKAWEESTAFAFLLKWMGLIEALWSLQDFQFVDP